MAHDGVMPGEAIVPKYPPVLNNLPLIHQGKTRDTFATNSKDHLLVVATNRLSTHNVVHRSEVPFKGYVLTALTVFWARLLETHGISTHVATYGRNIFSFLPGLSTNYPEDLYRRAIVIRKLKMLPVEFIYRGYLVGSLYQKFYKKGLANPYGIDLQPGLKVMSKFSVPAFTPTDKSETDDPLNALETRDRYPEATMLGEKIYTITRQHLHKVGVEEVDTKLEFGEDQYGNAIVADEIVTPDSSRFAPMPEIKEGVEPPWLDKQIARDEAEKIWGDGPKVPLDLPPLVISKLTETYLDILYKITGSILEQYTREVLA